MHLIHGNHLPDGPEVEDPVTVVEYVGELGMARCRVLPEASLGFQPDWKPFTLHGYGKSAKIPRMTFIDMSGAKEYWNFRVPENGSVHFRRTREERDAELSPEGLEAIRQLERGE